MNPTFWSRFAFGVRVVVAGKGPDRLLGIRDGFLRYLGEGTHLTTEIRIEAVAIDDGRESLPLDDAGILALARDRALELPETEEGDFRVGAEAGLLSMSCGGQERWMVRTWTVVFGLGEEAWGASGSVQLPRPLIEGLEAADLPFHVPGTRRQGGMVASLTGGLERQREAIAQSTVLALSSLFYPYVETAGGERGGSRPLVRTSQAARPR